METASLDINGSTLKIETGKLAKQASGAVTVTLGETIVLSTAVMSKDTKFDIDYFPLQVHYSDKYYSIGKIPGGFIKREGRPKDKEVVTSRLIDRPLRPLFPEGFRNEIQILSTTISADQIHAPDVLGIIGASCALLLSEIPFTTPVGAVRVGFVNDQLILNPTYKDIEESELELIVAGTKDAIMMIDGKGKEVSEETMLSAIELAQGTIIEICKIQEELAARCGKDKVEVTIFEIEDELKEKVSSLVTEPIINAFANYNKLETYKEIDGIKDRTIDSLNKEYSDDKSLKIKKAIEDIEYDIVRKMIVEEDKRVDNRKMDEIRPISCEIGLLPRVHGTALFTRGETQSLGAVTLGTAMDMQRFDDIEGEGTKNFMLHYNFPPFSVGETGRVGGVGRREIGHGNLAENAIKPVLPSSDDFPYTIRIVSEILESNGSSSMATVCSASLALLDAGVPIKKPVSGIAMGLIMWKDKFKILTDIQGLEDHLGDMDFKVAGTKDGITAFQLDIKVEGITIDIMRQAFEQAKNSRLKILDIMDNTIDKAKESLSIHAPKIISMDVEPSKIKDVIGSGGKIIKKIIETTGANINIDDYGRTLISSKNEEASQKAFEYIKSIVTDPVVGTIYNGTVKRILNFGAFIEITPGKEGLCHISKLSKERVNDVRDLLEEGQEVKVKLMEIDRMGRINLSMKDVD